MVRAVTACERSCAVTACVVSSLATVDRPLQLLLRHPRPPLDAHSLGLVVELLLRAALGAFRPRAESTAPARGDVGSREPRGRLRLTGARALFVHGPRRDLLGLVLGGTALLDALLDVLVLSLALLGPCLRRHLNPFRSFRGRSSRVEPGLIVRSAAGSGRCARWRTRSSACSPRRALRRRRS